MSPLSMCLALNTFGEKLLPHRDPEHNPYLFSPDHLVKKLIGAGIGTLSTDFQKVSWYANGLAVGRAVHAQECWGAESLHPGF